MGERGWKRVWTVAVLGVGLLFIPRQSFAQG